MSKIHSTSFLCILLLLVSAFSCKEDALTDAFPGEKIAFLSGIFVLNDDNNSGTLTYFDKLNQNTSQEVFQTVNNGQTIGNGGSSMILTNQHLWISTTNDNSIVLADPDFLTEIRRISSINAPRSIVPVSEEIAYITHKNSGSSTNDFLTKIDSSGNTLATFTTKVTDNQPIISGNILYFPNGNLNSPDSTLTYINITADTIMGDSIIPALNPVELVAQSNGVVWVLCTGGIDLAGNTVEGALILLRNQRVDFKITLPSGAKNLALSEDAQYLFYTLEGKVYRQPTDNAIRETTIFINKDYTLLKIDPVTGNLYGAMSDGNIFRHNIENGEVTASFVAGNVPRDMVFK